MLCTLAHGFGADNSAHGIVCRFQGRDCLFPGDAGKRIDKLVEAVVSFEVVDQIAERDARADEYGSTAEDFLIAAE
jgi:hypothetical protein